MPYQTNADLPDNVRLHLPEHAQAIIARHSTALSADTKAIPGARKSLIASLGLL
jgi:cation transport regulator ChaB